MNKNVNLNLLKYFYEAVNCMNITTASEKLLVSQPAVTKAIKELESELNITLLERNKKGVLPTTEGKILYDHIKDMFQNLNSTISVLESEKEKGYLYIGATTTNFMNLIMEALKEFRKEFPNIHISIVLEELHILEDMAKLGKLDILIKNSYENMEGFCNIKSFDITDRFIVNKNYFPELLKRTYSLEELLDYPFVLLSKITQGRRNFDSYLKTKNIEFKPTYEFNSYSLCHELIKNGFGIGIGNPIHYSEAEFELINTDFELPTRTFDIGYIKSSKNKCINNFIDKLNK